MKTFFFLLCSLFILSACSKTKCKKDKELVYFSEDYATKSITILGVPSNEIQALWVEFYDKNKTYSEYALMVKANNEIVAKEYGTCNVNWGTNLSLITTNESTINGDFVNGKDSFTLMFSDELRSENITFNFKK